MNTLRNLILTASAAAFASFTVQAEQPLLSPRLQSIQIRVVPGSSVNDPNLVANLPNGNGRAWEHARSRRTVPLQGPQIDLAHGPRPTLAPKDPRYEQVFRELSQERVQIAPLK